MTEQKYYAREARMQNLRWATPAGLFILTVVLGISGWVGTDYLTQIRNAITDLKSDGNTHYTALWQEINASKSRIDCVQNQLAKCCKDSTYCI